MVKVAGRKVLFDGNLKCRREERSGEGLNPPDLHQSHLVETLLHCNLVHLGWWRAPQPFGDMCTLLTTYSYTGIFTASDFGNFGALCNLAIRFKF